MSDLIALVTEVEADVNAEGWDFEPIAFVLTEDEERGLHFEELSMPTALFGGDIGDTMSALANKGVQLAKKAQGMLLINEAWGIRMPVESLHEDGSYDGIRASDHPDRIEVRMATLLTRDGKMICGQRERIANVFEVHEAEPEHIAMQMKARFPYLMYILLHGEEPK